MKYNSFCIDGENKDLVPSEKFLNNNWNSKVLFEMSNTKVELCTSSDLLESDDPYFLVIETSGQQIGKSIMHSNEWTRPDNKNNNKILLIEFLKYQLLGETKFSKFCDDLRNNKCFLLVIFEEQSMINTSEFFRQLDNFVTEIGIKKQQLCFLISEFYYNGYKTTDYPIFQYPFYAYNICQWQKSRVKEMKEFYSLYFNYSWMFLKQKHFVCTNNRIRDYRTWIMFILKKNNLFDKGYVSYLANNEDPDNQYNVKQFLMETRRFTEAPFGYSRKELDEFYKLLPINCDVKKNVYIRTKESHWPIQNILFDSYFNIITESDFGFGTGENKVFLTEKTWKPILNHQPFFIISNPNYLKGLKELGFKTFDTWLDESYDSVTADRGLLIIEKEIKRICDMSIDEVDELYWNMKDVLEHNFNHFFEIIYKSLDDLEQFIKESFNDLS